MPVSLVLRIVALTAVAVGTTVLMVVDARSEQGLPGFRWLAAADIAGLLAGAWMIPGLIDELL